MVTRARAGVIRVEGEGDRCVWIFTVTLLVRLRGLMHTRIGKNHVNLSENRGARPCGTDISYSWHGGLWERLYVMCWVFWCLHRECIQFAAGGRASSCCSPYLPTESPPSLCFFLYLSFLYCSSFAFNSLYEYEPSASQIAFPFHERRNCYLQSAWWVCNLSYVMWRGEQESRYILCITSS